MSTRTKKIELCLDEFLAAEFREKTRVYPTVVSRQIGRCDDPYRLQASAWLREQDALNALYDNRPPPAEQRAMFAAMGLEFVDQDAPVAAYPTEPCEADAGQPAGQRVDRLIYEYQQAYQYGIGGTYAGSPGAQHHTDRATIATAA